MEILQQGRVLDLMLFIILTGIMYYYLRKVERGESLPSIRMLPAYEAIEEGIGRAIETGKMVFFESGFATLTRGPYVPMTMAGMNVLRHVSRLCARIGAKFQFGATDTEVLPLAEGIIEEAYTIEGKSDEFNADMVRYFGRGFAGNMSEASYMVEQGCAALIMVGAFSTSCLVLLGASKRSGAITIGGTARWIMMYAFGIAANYVFILEDIYAASALASNDPTIITTLAGEDVLKIGIIVATILCIILALIGFDIATFLGR
jgi:hypothetical protein